MINWLGVYITFKKKPIAYYLHSEHKKKVNVPSSRIKELQILCEIDIFAGTLEYESMRKEIGRTYTYLPSRYVWRTGYEHIINGGVVGRARHNQ